MTDSTAPDTLIYDPEEVIFDADGNVESMTDPDTGEKITSDPQPSKAPDATGPYDRTDDNGNNPGDAGAAPAGGDELDAVLADTLAVYGLDDDAIEWNGEETRVRDLSPADRREFLGELRERDRQQASELTPEQRELIDFLNAGGNLREALGDAPASGAGGSAALSADELNLADIRQQYPNLNDDEVQEELADRKLSARYESKTGQIRERFGAQETALAQRAEAEQYQAEREQFVQAGQNLKTVLGFPVEPAVREFLLAQTATQAENGQSPFLNSLTPDKVLRLQFLDTYADQIDQHYKSEVTAAYKKGRQDALSGAPSTPSGRGGSAGNARPGGNYRDEKVYEDYTLGE